MAKPEKFDLGEIVRDTNKEIGSNIMFDLTSDIKSSITAYCDTGVKFLNAIISGDPNGGLPYGRVVEIYAEESVGKTTIAGQLIANAQKAGGIGVFFDSERAFDEKRAQQLGIDFKRYIYADAETLEDTLAAIEAIMKNISKKYPKMPIVIVWDSIGSTPSKAEVTGTYDQVHMAVHAKVLSQGLRKMINTIAECNVLLVCISQAKEEIGGYVPKFTSLGGKSLKFHSSVRLELRRAPQSQDIKNGEIKIGHTVKVKTVKNKIFRPLLLAEIPLLYDSGLSNDLMLFDLFCSKGIIKQTGAWYNFQIEDKEYKFQEKNWLEKLKEPEVRAYFDQLMSDYKVVEG